MVTAPELVANAFNAASIVLAGRNSVHTWWTGIVGCLAFAWVFAEAKLYADGVLQAFFVITSVIGWWHWTHAGSAQRAAVLPVRRTSTGLLVASASVAVVVALIYAAGLRRYTDAAAPLPDSLVLTFSVLGQLLMMGRRLETWWCWLAVNTLAVPLYLSRDLLLTAALYAAFWLNAVASLRHWRALVVAEVRRVP